MHDENEPGSASKKAIPVNEAPYEASHHKSDSSEFKTPEQAAMQDKTTISTEKKNKPIVDPRTKSKPTLRERLVSLTKKQNIIIAIVAAVILLGGGGTAFALMRHKPAPKPVAKLVPLKAVPPPAPNTVASPLTGVQVAPDVLQRPVTGVMIENSIDARPQSGLDQAGVVFEAVAEGGITRFLALFQDTQPTYIGPVRSARPYYLGWCLSFDCALAHAGGSPEALTDIPAWNVKNLDEFANSGSFHRISSRVAPHNLYSGLPELNNLESSKGYGAAKFTSFMRKHDTPAKTPTASVIDLAISSSYYNANYVYNPATDGYVRNEGDQPHVQIDDAGQPTQITPKVVIALVMSQGLAPDDHHTSYGYIGSGVADVFQDGLVLVATWHKADNNAPLTFTDSNNHPVLLNAGQTWLTVVGNASYISYKP